LPQKIINSELSGVFNWVLEGLKRILENKRLCTQIIFSYFLENSRYLYDIYD